MPTPRNQLLARVHCIKKEQGWSDDEYRDILFARTGYRSAGDLDGPALARLVALIGGEKSAPATRRGGEWAWVNDATADKRPVLWKIRRLCIEIGVPQGRQVAYAEGVAKRQHGIERRLRMMTGDEQWMVARALSRTLQYKAKDAPPPEGGIA